MSSLAPVVVASGCLVFFFWSSCYAHCSCLASLCPRRGRCRSIVHPCLVFPSLHSLVFLSSWVSGLGSLPGLDALLVRVLLSSRVSEPGCSSSIRLDACLGPLLGEYGLVCPLSPLPRSRLAFPRGGGLAGLGALLAPSPAAGLGRRRAEPSPGLRGTQSQQPGPPDSPVPCLSSALSRALPCILS